MISYATTDDIASIWRTLTTAETTKAATLIPIASSIIRKKGEKAGVNTDTLYAEDTDYALLLKMTVVSMVSRALNKDTAAAPMSQFTQSALGYSYTGTVLSPGQDLYLLNNEAKVWASIAVRKSDVSNHMSWTLTTCMTMRRSNHGYDD